MKNIIALIVLIILLSGVTKSQLKDEVQFGAGLQTVIGESPSLSLMFQFTTFSPERMGYFINVSVGMWGRCYSHMIIPVNNFVGGAGLQYCVWNKSAFLVGYGFGANYNDMGGPYKRHRGWLIGGRWVSLDLFQNRRDNVALTLTLSPASVETLEKNNKWARSHKNIVTLGVTWNI